MKLRLTDGSIVEAVKDCECCTHDGPCWIHMDELDRERSRRELAAGNWRGHAVMELQRLREKLYQMKSRGVCEIIRD